MTSWPKATCPRDSQPPAWPCLHDSTPRCNKSTEAADLSKKSILFKLFNLFTLQDDPLKRPDSTPRCNKSSEAADLCKKSIVNPPASPLKDCSRRLLQVLLTKVFKANVTVSCKSSTSSWPLWSLPIRPLKRCATRTRLRIPRHRRWFGWQVRIWLRSLSWKYR